MLIKSFKDLDRVLRGEKTRLSELRDGSVDVSFPGITTLVVVLGGLTGLCMGVFALLRNPPEVQQMVASTVKVPLLFLLTLMVTFPSLYVFNALVGSRLRLVALSKLLIASLGVTVALTAAFGPIVAFFSLSTASYPFMVLLNVVSFTVAGVLGLYFLLQTLHRITTLDVMEAQAIEQANVRSEGLGDDEQRASEPAKPDSAQPQGALEKLEGFVLAGHVKIVFRCWVILFALVGSQMSWVLRPFIGSPGDEFSWFRERHSNFFSAVFNAIQNLFQ